MPGQPGLRARRAGDLFLDRAGFARAHEIELPGAAIGRLGGGQEIARRRPDQRLRRDRQMAGRRRVGQDEAAVVVLHRERDRELVDDLLEQARGRVLRRLAVVGSAALARPGMARNFRMRPDTKLGFLPRPSGVVFVVARASRSCVRSALYAGAACHSGAASPIAAKRPGRQFNEKPFEICFNRMPPRPLALNRPFTPMGARPQVAVHPTSQGPRRRLQRARAAAEPFTALPVSVRG